MNSFASKKVSLGTTLVGAIAAFGLSMSMLGAGALETSAASAVSQAKVGQMAPDFTLLDLEGNEHTLSEYTAKGQTVVLEWFSPLCPFVKKHYRDDTMTMVNIQKDLKGESVVWLRINSAKASHPAADLETNKKTAKKWDITTPILMDPDGDIGRMYKAKRTPEMYIIDSSGVLAYHGAIDNNSNASAAGDVNYVRDGLVQTLAGEEITTSTTKAYGCSVKY